MEVIRYSLDDLRKLPPEQRKEYYKLLILDALRANPEGITLSQLANLTKIDIRTVAKHLEYLVAVREVYKKEFGKRLALYFPNIDISNPLMTKKYEIDGHFYTFKFIKNDFGEFVYIQEKERDPYTNTFSIQGGIIIPKSKIKDFIRYLEEFLEVSQ